MKVTAIATIMIVTICAVFVGGVFAGPWFVHYRSPVTTSRTFISIHPATDEPIFSSEIYEELNLRIENYLTSDEVRNEYPRTRPNWIVAPSVGGYTSYYWLENKEMMFPDSLVEKCNAIIHEVIWGPSEVTE